MSLPFCDFGTGCFVKHLAEIANSSMFDQIGAHINFNYPLAMKNTNICLANAIFMR